MKQPPRGSAFRNQGGDLAARRFHPRNYCAAPRLHAAGISSKERAPSSSWTPANAGGPTREPRAGPGVYPGLPRAGALAEVLLFRDRAGDEVGGHEHVVVGVVVEHGGLRVLA